MNLLSLYGHEAHQTIGISAVTNMKVSPKDKKATGSIKLYSSLRLEVAKAVSFKCIFTFILTCYFQKCRLGKSFCKPYFHSIALIDTLTDSSTGFMTFLTQHMLEVFPLLL